MRLITERVAGTLKLLALLGVSRRQVLLIVALGTLYAAFEGLGVAMLLPVLRYVEQGPAVFAGDGGSRLSAVALRLSETSGLPLLLVLVLLAFVPVLARQVFRYWHQVTAERIRWEATERLRTEGFAALMQAQIRFFVAEGPGRLTAVLTSEIERGTSALLYLLQLYEGCVLLAVYLVVLFSLASWLVPVALLAIVGVALLVRKRIAQSRQYGAQISAGYDAFHVAIAERVSGIRLVKMRGQEARETQSLRGIVGDLTRLIVRVCRVQGLEVSVEPVMILGAFVALYVAVTAFGMTLSGLGLFMFALLRIVPQLKQINVARQQIAVSAASLENVRTTVAQARAARDFAGGSVTFRRLQREIVFDRVGFSYDGDGVGAAERVLRDVSFRAPRGSLTAIVGRSGAGKSTLLDLIPRLREASEGGITFDGISIREFELGSLRAAVGIVDQQGFLFNDTVAYNIAYGRPGVPREAIERAARGAYAHDFVAALSQGYDTVVGERGLRLSMGQRQRLNLARVLLENPDILLLDEPTSALDAESEQYIQAVLDDLRRDKVIIVVAHRFSTIRGADQIIVLDRGRIVEQGDHETLIKYLGTYKQLYDLQIHA